jgi:HlyD family secretion protein
VNVRLSVVSLIFAAACGARASSSSEATGTLELTDVDVAPLLPARVTKVWRDEGDRVRAGDTLLTLTQSTLSSNIAGQQAAVQAAEAQLRDLLAGPRPSEIARAESELAAAQAEASRAEEDLKRVTPLAERGVTSKQQLDAARAAARSTASRRDALRDAVRRLKEGARPDQIAAARASVAAARAALSGVQQTATDLVLVAPIAGTVLSRNAEPGEVLAAGAPAMTIADPGRPYVRIYVDQVKFPSIRVGDTVGVFLDAYPDRRFRGLVSAVNNRAEFTPRVALTRDERADLMYGVKVQLVDTSSMLKAGLPVTVRLPRPAGK